MKRIVTVNDLHCGNVAGLTPPNFNPRSEEEEKMFKYRAALYRWYKNEMDKLQPIDICVCNGDAIDGQGKKTGGTEQLTTDRLKQIDMATRCLLDINATKYYFSFGTGYHVGPEEDMEREIAKNFDAPIKDVTTIEMRGVVMKWRHHIGTSQSPQGRATALLKEQQWDLNWAWDGEFPFADILTFGHAHYFEHVMNRLGAIFISPGLQGLDGSSYGGRRMGGTVDFGFLHFDVEDNGEYSWRIHRLPQTHAVRNGALPQDVLAGELVPLG